MSNDTKRYAHTLANIIVKRPRTTAETCWKSSEIVTRWTQLTVEEIEIEQGLTSHQTHYMSYRGQFLQII